MGVQNLLDLAKAGLEGTVARPHGIYFALMEELCKQVKYPVVFAIDDHNELFKVPYQLPDFFRDFCISTGRANGVLQSTSFLH